MATLKEIATAAEKADKAGNTEDAKKLVDLYFKLMEQNAKGIKQKNQKLISSKSTYDKFKNAETQGLEGIDSFIRTKASNTPEGSSAYGPVQLTGILVQEMVNQKVIPNELMDYTNRFLEQSKKFLKYGNEPNLEGYEKKYDYGGSGDLTSEQDMEDYKNLANVIIKHHEDKANGDELKLINSWRFGFNSNDSVETKDKDYLERFRK
tara:strand:+ start:152 stop:772 length:621 start_codon:yes stop_codon:yes gene_type:complete